MYPLWLCLSETTKIFSNISRPMRLNFRASHCHKHTCFWLKDFCWHAKGQLPRNAFVLKAALLDMIGLLRNMDRCEEMARSLPTLDRTLPNMVAPQTWTIFWQSVDRT